VRHEHTDRLFECGAASTVGTASLRREGCKCRDVDGGDGRQAPETEVPTRGFLTTFDVLGIDSQIAERSVQLRRSLRIRLPDAIIWPTAQPNAMLLVTRNTKDFPAIDPGVRVPYAL